MTKAGKSLFVFGIYVLLLGLLFVCLPGTLLSLMNLPALVPGWARVIGLLALIVGTFDVIAGRQNLDAIVRGSVYTRLCFATGIALLVLAKEMPPVAFLFSGIDTAGAVWTALALKRDAAVT